MSTSVVGIIIIAILVIWDIFLAVDQTVGNTWSEVIRTWAKTTLIVPWCWGGLGGHFFHWFTKAKPIIDRPGNIALLIWLSACIALLSPVLKTLEIDSLYVMMIVFFIGTFIWMLLWPV